MEITGPMIDAIVLFALVAILTLQALAADSSNEWFERRLPWLFPEAWTRSMEAIASDHPLRYAAIFFLLTIGALAMANDLGAQSGPLLRYGAAMAVAVCALHGARQSASERAA